MSNPSPAITPEFRELHMAVYQKAYRDGQPLMNGESGHMLQDVMPRSMPADAVIGYRNDFVHHSNGVPFNVRIDAFNEALGMTQPDNPLVSDTGNQLNNIDIQTPTDGTIHIGSLSLTLMQFDRGQTLVLGELLGHRNADGENVSDEVMVSEREHTAAAYQLLSLLGIESELLKQQSPGLEEYWINDYLVAGSLPKVTRFIMNLEDGIGSGPKPK